MSKIKYSSTAPNVPYNIYRLCHRTLRLNLEEIEHARVSSRLGAQIDSASLLTRVMCYQGKGPMKTYWLNQGEENSRSNSEHLSQQTLSLISAHKASVCGQAPILSPSILPRPMLQHQEVIDIPTSPVFTQKSLSYDAAETERKESVLQNDVPSSSQLCLEQSSAVPSSPVCLQVAAIEPSPVKTVKSYYTNGQPKIPSYGQQQRNGRDSIAQLDHNGCSHSCTLL